MGAGIPSLPPPVFVNDADGLNPNLILADMIAEFEAAAGRTLYPAQVERLLINLYAYRESLVRNAIQYAAEQNLLAFASFPMLDYLGQLLGVTRLASQPAVTTLLFTLANALTVAFTIAAGTLAGTNDGQFNFATSATVSIAAGAMTASVAGGGDGSRSRCERIPRGAGQRPGKPQRLDRERGQYDHHHWRFGAGNGQSPAHANSGCAESVQCRGAERSVPLFCHQRRPIDHRCADCQPVAGIGERVRVDRADYRATGGGAEQRGSRELGAARESVGGVERRHGASAHRHRQRARGHRGGLPDYRDGDAVLGRGSDGDDQRGDGGGAGTRDGAGVEDSARHRAEPDNRGAVGRGSLRCDADDAGADHAQRRAVGELHDDLADDGVQHGA